MRLDKLIRRKTTGENPPPAEDKADKLAQRNRQAEQRLKILEANAEVLRRQ